MRKFKDDLEDAEDLANFAVRLLGGTPASTRTRIERWAKRESYGFSLVPHDGRWLASVWRDAMHPSHQAWGDTEDEALEAFRNDLREDGIRV